MKKIFFSLLSIMLVLGISCSKDDTANNGNANVSFHLTDAPGAYDAVYVDVQSVLVQSNQDSGWTTLDLIKPGVYDLLDFRNGTDTLLSRTSLPAGSISQIRLILGTNNSVVVNGVSYPLSTPSAMQSGLKFNFHQTLDANRAYDIWIDFDANKSIVNEGNGSYALKPVIRAYSQETNGQIKGYVLPSVANPIVLAIQGTDTLSAIPGLDGFFMFSGLANGSYNITFKAGANTNYKDSTLTNVNVTYGQITNLGSTTLLQL